MENQEEYGYDYEYEVSRDRTIDLLLVRLKEAYDRIERLEYRIVDLENKYVKDIKITTGFD